VQIDIKLRKDTPVKTDTKATLMMKGITGTVYIELAGGSVDAPALLAATPPGQIPEIPSQKSSLATILDDLPKVIAKFSAIEDKTNKVVADVGGLTSRLKENPSLLVWPSKQKEKEKEKEKETRPISKQ